MFPALRRPSWIQRLALPLAILCGVCAPLAAAPIPELYVEPLTVDEGDTFYSLDIKVKMVNGPAAVLVSAEYLTIDIDAEAPNDYYAAGGLVTFQPGSVEETVTLTIAGDTFFEQNESFYFKIFNPNNAIIPVEKAAITLRNDDLGAGTFNIGDAEVLEGDEGTSLAVFTVELDSPPGVTTTDPLGIQWKTRAFTAGASDFVPAEGMVYFPAPGTTETFEVQVRGDTLVEETEFFFVDLVYSTGAVIGRSSGRGVILNDDHTTTALPTLSVDDAAVEEGDSGTTEVEVTLRLSEPSEAAVEAPFHTEAGSAEAGVDFQPTEGVVVFEPGVTERSVTLGVVGDTLVEEDETFKLVLVGPTGAEIEDGEADITILDDDTEVPPPRLDIDDVTVTEGDEGTTLATFTVRLTGTPLSDAPVTVTYRTANLSATGEDRDYVPTGGSLSFPNGTTEQSFDVQVLGDTRVEPDERFGVLLEDPVGATLIRNGATGSILNDDSGSGGGGGAGGGGGGGGDFSTVRIAGVDSAAEGEGAARVRVERLVATNAPVQVTLVTSDGTARSGQDFRGGSTRVSWQAGETGIKNVSIPIIDDSTVESNERFGVALRAPTGARLGTPSRAGLTITDNDVPMRLEAVGDTELTGTTESELELQAKVLTEDGRPVEGAPVVWAAEGRVALVGDERVVSGSDGIASRTVRLDRRPGPAGVVARLPGTDHVVTFRIRVEGNLAGPGGGPGDGGEETVAQTLDRNCADAESGDYSTLCDFLFGLPDGERAQALQRLSPEGALAHGRAALRGPGQQLRNVGARLTALRSGMARQSLGQLAFLIQGDPLSLGPIQRAMKEGSKSDWAAASVGAALREGLETPYDFLDDDDPAPAAGTGGDPDADNLGESPWGFFANGRLSFGDAPRLGSQAGYDLSTQGLTAGVDYRLGTDWVLGAALGYVRSDSDIELSAGSFDLQGTSLSLYVTYFRDDFYVDGVLSYGRQAYDIERVVELPRPIAGVDRFVAVGEPDSVQTAAHLGAGYDFRLSGALTLSGFVRTNWVRSTIDAYTERGAFFFDLSYDEQESESLLGEAGLEITRPFSLSWGVVQPLVRLAYLQEFEDGAQILRARFAVDPRARTFTIESETPDRSFFNLALGVTVTLPRSWASYFQYDTDLERDDLDIYTLSGGFRFQF